ncbi:L,D-transpeptidase [Companilactobacillus nantensis]|uniref:L,D-TPase catalytic domain-containing protein n=1 Tax=Companilactobacillus nantensis DSM 16982 TaxID=1423774 RepID=A0A0R1WI18_9LACO|nr:L,D-transpeptidase [Companilactobacillus nantensis]KRM17658.1 hypothetical protein FD31_GL002417 [Companilactobacillus nantensis DSM 16982]GEO63409.1 hypothetical protein LNA01_05920 [Companilactobacillus nantensis]
MKNKKIITAVIALIGSVMIGFVVFVVNSNNTHTVEAEQKSAKVVKKAKKTEKAKKLAEKKKILNEWKHPSEAKDYPDLNKHQNAYLEVSIPEQRVYVKDGKKTLYTMKAATGEKKSPTPKGTFEIQNRGDSFYNESSKEGANYWTSFKDWGVYLFHSVPTDKNGKYVESEAHKLGKRSSHGCVRLTIPDAKWINASVPDGMKVVVK